MFRLIITSEIKLICDIIELPSDYVNLNYKRLQGINKLCILNYLN